METNDRGYLAPANAREWFERRSYSHKEFKDVAKLARRKRELGLTVSLVLPSRNVADTVGGIVEEATALNEEAPLVDQILVIDADTKDFLPQFVYGTLGPIISVPSVRFVKGAFRRPFKSSESLELDGGGRVTELTTKPLFNLFYPELTGFVQPLAGEFVADKELFSSIPFLTGYAVETGIMIDVYKKVGLEAMAQVDLGTRQNRHQPLFDLGKMSYAVLRAVARRLREDGRLRQVRDPSTPDSLFQFSDYLHAVATPEGLKLREHVEELVERAPIKEVLKVG